MKFPGIIGGTKSANYYGQIIKTIHIILENEEFISRYKNGDKAFSRDRVFTFKTLVVFLMSQLQRAIQRELDDFVREIRQSGASLARVSKAAFSKARNKLKHGAFVELREIIVKDFYVNCPFKQSWKGYRVIGVDGSTAELPNSDEVQQEFGVHTVRPDGKKICVARICELFDPMNNLTIAGKLSSLKASETAMFWDMFQADKTLGAGDIFIFDRYYFSSVMAIALHERGADFCFRVKQNWSPVMRMVENNQTDELIELGIQKKATSKANKLGITTKKITCRLVRIQLENGENEFLLTSLTDSTKISVEDLRQLYFFRWGIEEHYKKLKHRVCIENFSGKSVESVYQDYYAKLFIINLTSVLIQPVDKVLEEAPKKKYVHQVNYTEALSKMKFVPVKLFIKNKVKSVIATLHQWFVSTTEPIRPGRKYKRTKLPKRKYHQNYKPV